MYYSPCFYNMMRSYNENLYSREIKNEVSRLPSSSLDDKTVNLVLDNQNYTDIPKNFRKSTTSLTMQNKDNLNLIGLDKLNISGSQQFSKYSLPLVIKSIGLTLPILVIDLRQESHGFINGAPVSWVTTLNNANIGLTRQQVLTDEYYKLNSIKLGVPLTYYNHKNITVIPREVENEKYLVSSKGLSYARITVTDGKIPLDDMVDYFIQLVRVLPKNTWIHFHCKQGIGRTTTFMIMYDMIRNANRVSADDIIKRQLLLASFDESHIKSFYNNERISFLQNFYKYCLENSNEFN